MRLIRSQQLVVGERLGRGAQGDALSVPLQRDLDRLQKRLRLAARRLARDEVLSTSASRPTWSEAASCTDSACSASPWGRPVRHASGRGTFKEAWGLCFWKPELAVALIEASVWGATIEDAATALAADRLRARRGAWSRGLSRTCSTAQSWADLPAAVEAIMARVESLAAVAADVTQLMDALPPLAGTSRGTAAYARPTPAMVGHAAWGWSRVSIGLPMACSSLDDAAAGATLFQSILRADAAIGSHGR